MISDEEAKVAGKGLDIVHDVGGFVARYIGGSLEQGIGIFEDKLRYMRWERQQRLIKRSNELSNELGLPGPTRAVPLKIASPLIQEASLEENDELQDRWVALLVNAANSDCNKDIKRTFVTILSQLSAYEVRVLDSIYSVSLGSPEAQIWTRDLPDKVLRESPPEQESRRPHRELELALATLDQLGLIVSQMMFTKSFECIGQTALGEVFVAACRLES